MADSATNWIDFLISLSPVVQAAIWAGVAVGVLWTFRNTIRDIADHLSRRIEQGDDLKTPWLSLQRIKRFEAVEQGSEEIVRDFFSNEPPDQLRDKSYTGIVADRLLQKIRKQAFLTVGTTPLLTSNGQ